VPIVLKSGNLKLLEPSGPVQACNGIALPCCHILRHDKFLDMLKLFIQGIVLAHSIVRAVTAGAVAYPGIFFGGGGGSTNSVEDRENGDLGVVDT